MYRVTRGILTVTYNMKQSKNITIVMKIHNVAPISFLMVDMASVPCFAKTEGGRCLLVSLQTLKICP